MLALELNAFVITTTNLRNMQSQGRTATIRPLSAETFAAYGFVVDATRSSTTANQNTAKRFNYLAHLVNNRPQAKGNICVFRVQPAALPFSIKLLERHRFSTQLFSPMTTTPAGYLVVVALNDPKTDKPDFGTLSVFKATSRQAFCYHPGVWHHPMIGLEAEIDFLCHVYEDGTTGDLDEVFFPKQAILAKL